MAQAEIGIIGGSGLYAMPGLSKVKEVRVKTPFGAPSDAYVCGTLEGRKVAFLARHGRGHRILPSELNFRANIHGFKQLGVSRIVSVSAVGSLKEEHKPTDFVMPDQSSTGRSRGWGRSSGTGLWRMWGLAIRCVRQWLGRLCRPAPRLAWWRILRLPIRCAANWRAWSRPLANEPE